MKLEQELYNQIDAYFNLSKTNWKYDSINYRSDGETATLLRRIIRQICNMKLGLLAKIHNYWEINQELNQNIIC
jgi:hypothetical protein